MNYKHKIAYIDFFDKKYYGSWYITTQNVKRILSRSFEEVSVISNITYPISLYSRVKKRLYRLFTGKFFLPDRTIRLMKHYSEIVSKQICKYDFDVILTNTYYPVSYLNTEKPIFFWCDASFESMVNFYPGFYNLCKESIIDGKKIEYESIKRCRLAIFTTEWAAKSVKEAYPEFKEKIKVLTWGANFESGLNEEQIKYLIYSKSKLECYLLFVGMDWYRKGGDIVLEILKYLIKSGIKTKLTIVGTSPEIPFDLIPYVEVMGVLNFADENAAKILREIYCKSHIMLMPARAEAFGIVYCEANTFGIPAIGSNVGGVSSVILDGVNGKLFNRDATIEQYSEYIINLFNDTVKYTSLCMSSYRHYKEKFDWQVVESKLKELILENF